MNTMRSEAVVQRDAGRARPRDEPVAPGSAVGGGEGSQDDVGGWAGGVMRGLQVVAQVVGINLLILLGSLAGLVLVGTFPALRAGSGLLARLVRRDPSERLWREFWRDYRSCLGRDAVLGAPFWGIGAFLLADVTILHAARSSDVPTATSAIMLGAVLALSAYALLVLVWFVPALRRYRHGFGATWRLALLGPALSLPLTLAMLVTLAAFAFVALSLPVVVPLMGVSLPLLLTGWLVDRRLDELDRSDDDG